MNDFISLMILFRPIFSVAFFAKYFGRKKVVIMIITKPGADDQQYVLRLRRLLMEARDRIL